MLYKRVLTIVSMLGVVSGAAAWTPLPVTEDPLVRMPGTQPGEVDVESSGSCLGCHGTRSSDAGPGFAWKGSMMAQASRDFLFLASMTVAVQDSIWALGNPNATDLCERCHFPEGWVEGRSDPTNASLMTGSDTDGVQCTICHSMWDPFFEDTHAGTREGNDWIGYWDESNASDTPSQTAADETHAADVALTSDFYLFSGDAFFDATNQPLSPDYTENNSGQFFLSGETGVRRGPFADANPMGHSVRYSRYHKSKYFCGACHDVSNSVLVNLEAEGEGMLPSEAQSAFSHFHVERTFSEFMLSAYGQDGGTAGLGAFAPDQFDTVLPENRVGRCQDCHMPAASGVAATVGQPVDRPGESTEHPNSGMPEHNMAGGNIFVSEVLASIVEGAEGYDVVNADLLKQGFDVLTLDFNEGVPLDAKALLANAAAAREMLERAAALEQVSYDEDTHVLRFRVQNQTGHKLPTGFPEGRRVFVNVRAYDDGALVHEINPYDTAVGTLKGLPPSYSFNSPALGDHEVYDESLVFEMHPKSDLTGETETFHFLLGTGRYKDNRIPPKGFLPDQAATRFVEPVWHGEIDLDYFSAEENAGGYDAVSLTLPVDAERLEIRLFYQTTSREYIEFLRDEINGDATSLRAPTPANEGEAYIADTDPFFDGLRAWGDTVWALWEHNKDRPGAAPLLLAQVIVGEDDEEGEDDEGEGEGEGEGETEEPGLLGCGAQSPVFHPRTDLLLFALLVAVIGLLARRNRA
jgi:hypothetical protein